MNAPTTPPARRRVPRELLKILGDCRDLAIHRLLLSFSSLLDRVADLLMDRASKTDAMKEQQLFLDARSALKSERPSLMAEFEKRLRQQIDDRISGRTEAKVDFSKADTTKMTLVDTTAMDESVITGNITRVVENLCHDELLVLNRGFGHLMGEPDLETEGNPLAPGPIVHAFAEALRTINAQEIVKFTILKELNQTSLGEINAIYTDLNRHLKNLKVVPEGARPSVINRARGAERGHLGGEGAAEARAEARAAAEAAAAEASASAEIDVMALFKRMFAGRPVPMAPAPFGQPMAPMQPSYGQQPMGADGFPQISMPMQAAPAMSQWIPQGPLPPLPSGYVPGAPIMMTPSLGEGLSRLQAGESGFELGDGGGFVQFSGIPQGTHNVLRDLQESPLGRKANQLESMTIELVAMLFDFIFETRDLPDGIKALLARLQIPVLKAAMLDGAFFAKKSHPSRLLVNALAHAGLGWSPVMGADDPLYKQIASIVHRILDEFTDNLALFDELRDELEAYLAEEEQAAEANILTTADEINQRDRHQISVVVAKSEIERRIESYPIPNFLAGFLRQKWTGTLEQVYLQQGEESEAWGQAVATLEDIVWSVQPKKSSDDRKHLVAMLPSLLKRLAAGVHGTQWAEDERSRFMTNLVEAHAAAVKPSLAAMAQPIAAMAEQAKAEAEVAKASGDEARAAEREQFAEAMSTAEPAPIEEAAPPAIDDQFLEIAQSLERGVWVEFEGEDGQLAFAKLAWISPLRGTYLFTNRQGQKAMSMTAEELAERFRDDRARLVEAEPLIDRAFSSMMSTISEKFPEPAPAE